MQFLYKIPGYILCLFAGFWLSFGGPLIRSFEAASPWQILFWRSLFFLLALVAFLILTYKKEAFNIIKKAGFPGILGGFFLSTSFVGYVFSITETTIANVVFIISSQTLFLAIFGYFFLKEKISLRSFIAIILAVSGVILMVGDSVSSGSLIGNLAALLIPINFSILIVIIRKHPNLDMVPAIFYSGILSAIYGFILSEKCTNNSYTYTLTDEGAAMLRELSASSVSHSLSFYRNSRRAYAELLKDLDSSKPICFLGVSDLLPIAADVASAKGFGDVCFFASSADYDQEITRDLHLQSCNNLDSKANIASFVATTVHIKKFIPALNSVGLTVDSINIPNLSEITGLLELV